jgi:ABC-type transporter Mla subunit MlaD
MGTATRGSAATPGIASLARRIDASRVFVTDATLGALTAVRGLSASARAHEKDLSSLAAVARSAASRAENDGGVAGAVRDLVGATRTLVAVVRDKGRAQHDAATRAARSAEAIAALARDVGAVTTNARLLAINANVAATKLGHVGRAASVISTRVHALSCEMAAEAENLGELSHELTALLPAIAERTAALVEAGEAFSGRASTMLARVEELHASLGGHVAGEIRECEQRVHEVAAHASAIDAGLRAHREAESLLQAARQQAAAGDGAGTVQTLERTIQASIACVTPANDRLMALNDLARRQGAALTGLSARFGGDGTEADLTGLSRSLASLVEAFVREARGHIEEQLRGVELAVQSEGRRYGAAEACRRLVMESRMLTLAVRVEAARIGAHGAGILPIADQLGGFTDQLDGAVAGAATTTEALRTLLTRLRAHSQTITDATESFAAAAERAQHDLEEALRHAGGGVEAALGRSRERAQSLLDASHALITQLQFQDRLTQELRSIQTAVASPESTAPAKSFLDTKNDDGLSAGELMLF